MSTVEEQVAATTATTTEQVAQAPTEQVAETPAVQDATTPAEVEQVLEQNASEVAQGGDEEVKQTQENVEKPVEEQAKEQAEEPVKEQESGNLKTKVNNMFKKYLKKFKTSNEHEQHNNNNNNNNSPNPTKTGSSTTGTRALDDPNVYHWICQLTYGPQREQALLELGRKREQYDDLAIVLWNSFGVMTSLLQEIISIYPFLNPPNLLTNQLSNRVCNALVLLQCVASHKDSKFQFIRSQLPFYLFPFLSTTNKSRSFEYLRLTSLGVIGALVKNDSKEVVQFLLKTDIIPLCLRIMESSTELSKTVAIFILQKIIMDDNGLQYICSTQERFMAVSNVLNHMVEHILNTPTGAAATAIGVSNATGNAPGTATNNTPAGQDTPSTTPPARLLKHIVRCYLRLSDNLEARQLLKHVLPRSFVENTTVVGNVNGNGVSIAEILNDDVNTNKCLNQLLNTLEE
ncbi:CCR4-NOT core subunit caf40 [Hanseniaspora osmophila]